MCIGDSQTHIPSLKLCSPHVLRCKCTVYSRQHITQGVCPHSTHLNSTPLSLPLSYLNSTHLTLFYSLSSTLFPKQRTRVSLPTPVFLPWPSRPNQDLAYFYNLFNSRSAATSKSDCHQAWQSELQTRTHLLGRRDPLVNCPLTFTCMLWHTQNPSSLRQADIDINIYIHIWTGKHTFF